MYVGVTVVLTRQSQHVEEKEQGHATQQVRTRETNSHSSKTRLLI